MSAAQVKYYTLEYEAAEPGKEQTFSFRCPRRLNKDGVCGNLIIAGRTTLKRDPGGQNGGIAQWEWDGNREKPTFGPSINCGGCWHGYIRAGRCIDAQGNEEPG